MDKAAKYEKKTSPQAKSNQIQTDTITAGIIEITIEIEKLKLH